MLGVLDNLLNWDAPGINLGLNSFYISSFTSVFGVRISFNFFSPMFLKLTNCPFLIPFSCFSFVILFCCLDQNAYACHNCLCYVIFRLLLQMDVTAPLGIYFTRYDIKLLVSSHLYAFPL